MKFIVRSAEGFLHVVGPVDDVPVEQVEEVMANEQHFLAQTGGELQMVEARSVEEYLAERHEVEADEEAEVG